MCNIPENWLIGFHSTGLRVHQGKLILLAIAPCRSAKQILLPVDSVCFFTLTCFTRMSLMLFRTPGEGAAPQALTL